MNAKRLGEAGGRVFALAFDEGDEAIALLGDFARDEGVSGAWLTGLGAFRAATIAWYDLDTKEYREIPVDEQVEVASLIGNLGVKEDGEIAVHVHVALGRRDGTGLAGHLIRGVVRPTLEVAIMEPGGSLTRAVDERFGLPLLDFGPREARP